VASVLARFTFEDEAVVEPELQDAHVKGYMPHFKLSPALGAAARLRLSPR
jgi:hypothetical protein